jgi:elongation factor P
MQLRAGMAVRLDGQICKILEADFKAGGGQQGGTVKARLQNVSTGRLSEPHFRPDERFEDLELQRHAMDFLYRDGDNAVFMNPESYEQVEVPGAIVGPSEAFLADGMRVTVEFFEGRPISVVFPAFIEVKVTDTAPPTHSGQDNAWKEAQLENGVKIHVPLFIGPGELVRVDLKTGKYLERVRGEKKKGT